MRRKNKAGKCSFAGIMAAIMSTADSQLLVTASAVSEDLYHKVFKPDAENKKVLWVSRVTVIVVAVIAYVIAIDPDSSIMGLVSNAWAGFGSAFGPLVLLSLYSLALGFVISLVLIVVVSLLTKAPSQEIIDEFEAVQKEK